MSKEASFLPSGYSTVHFGRQGTLEERILLQKNNTVISTWHDVPLWAAPLTFKYVNFICTVPKGTWVCHEVAQNEDYNPLRIRAKLSSSAGVARPLEPSHFTRDSPWNIGVLPQTYGDQDFEHYTHDGLPYDGRILEVFDVGRPVLSIGGVYILKPLAAFAVITANGQLAWKIIGINVSDPAADACPESSGGVLRQFSAHLEKIRSWLFVQESVAHRGQCYVGFEGSAVGPTSVLRLLLESYASWQAYDRWKRPAPSWSPRKQTLKPEDYLSLWQLYLYPENQSRRRLLPSQSSLVQSSTGAKATKTRSREAGKGSMLRKVQRSFLCDAGGSPPEVEASLDTVSRSENLREESGEDVEDMAETEEEERGKMSARSGESDGGGGFRSDKAEGRSSGEFELLLDPTDEEEGGGEEEEVPQKLPEASRSAPVVICRSDRQSGSSFGQKHNKLRWISTGEVSEREKGQIEEVEDIPVAEVFDSSPYDDKGVSEGASGIPSPRTPGGTRRVSFNDVMEVTTFQEPSSTGSPDSEKKNEAVERSNSGRSFLEASDLDQGETRLHLSDLCSSPDSKPQPLEEGSDIFKDHSVNSNSLPETLPSMSGTTDTKNSWDSKTPLPEHPYQATPKPEPGPKSKSVSKSRSRTMSVVGDLNLMEPLRLQPQPSFSDFFTTQDMEEAAKSMDLKKSVKSSGNEVKFRRHRKSRSIVGKEGWNGSEDKWLV